MFGRHFIFVGILFGAAVIPFAANSAGKVKQWFGGDSSGEAKQAAKPFDSSAQVASSGGLARQQPMPPIITTRIDGGPVADLAEVIRFDVPPVWVKQRWPNVTPVTAADDSNLTGYRVSLVTGTRLDDLAGSLTYYFTKQNFVRRIEFQGTTGDPRRLAALLTQKYDFEPQSPSQSGEIVYQVRWNRKPVSEFVCRSNPTARPDSPFLRFSLSLEINNFAAK